jgi:dephospho-CoA kinase
MLRDVLDRLYLEQNRENMQKLSTVIRRNFGEDSLAKVIYEDLSKLNSEVMVLDGVRRLADIKYLKELPGFKLAYIETDIKKRYERISKRGENTDDLQKSFKEFKKEHEGEAESQIKDLKNWADFFIDNNGTFDELHKQLDQIISKSKK